MFKGIVEIFQIDAKTGKVKKYIKKPNVILNSGKNSFWQNHGGYNMGWAGIGIGTNSTPADPSQTGLLSPLSVKGADAGGGEGNQSWCEKTFTGFTSSYTVCEAGIPWNRSDPNSYWNRVTFEGVTVDPNNNIKIKFTCTITD